VPYTYCARYRLTLAEQTCCTTALQHITTTGGTKDPRFATRLAAFSRWWGGTGKGSVARANFLQREVSAAVSAERLRRAAAAAGVTLAVGDFVTVENSATVADDSSIGGSIGGGSSVSSGSTTNVARTASRKTLVSRSSSVSVGSTSSHSTTTTAAGATAVAAAAAAATGTTAESRLRAFRIWYASGNYTNAKHFSPCGHNSSDEISLDSSSTTEKVTQTGLYKAALQRRTARLADRTVRYN
jgi:hypothetical protein